MPFTIPNEATAGDDQAEPDRVDVDILVAGYAGTGVISGCAVAAQGVPDMTVSVAAGQIAVTRATANVAAVASLAIGAAHATNPRFDLVTASGAGAVITAGVAAASPVFPSVPAGSVALASVYVPATVTSITTARIVDKRVILLLPLTFTDHGAAGAAEDIAATPGAEAHHRLLLEAPTVALTLSGAGAGACKIVVELVQDSIGGRLATWPASVKWPNGLAPALSTGANDRDRYELVTRDSGVTWDAVQVGVDFG